MAYSSSKSFKFLLFIKAIHSMPHEREGNKTWMCVCYCGISEGIKDSKVLISAHWYCAHQTTSTKAFLILNQQWYYWVYSHMSLAYTVPRQYSDNISLISHILWILYAFSILADSDYLEYIFAMQLTQGSLLKYSETTFLPCKQKKTIKIFWASLKMSKTGLAYWRSTHLEQNPVTV